MKNLKRALALLLCLVMVLSNVPMHAHAADGAANIDMEVSTTEVNVGDTFTIVVFYDSMKVASIGAPLSYDKALVEFVSAVGCDPDFADEIGLCTRRGFTQGKISTPEEAAAIGQVGFVVAGTEEVSYTACDIYTATFRAIAPGTVTFTLSENSDGTDGFNGVAATATVTINGSSEPECDHSSTKLVPNADGKTHNVVCANADCGETVTANVPCSGTDDGDHSTAVMCACGNTVTAATEHTYTQERRGTLKSAGDCMNKAVYAVKCDYCDHESDTLTVEGEYGDHTYGDLIPAQEAVHTETELKGAVAAHYLCQCGKYFTEGKVETTLAALTGDAPEHTVDPSKTTTETTKEPTCTEEGTKSVSTFCSCGYAFPVDTQTIPAVGTAHDWNTPTYSWSADGTTCTATRTCKHDAAHKEEETVEATPSVTTVGTCQIEEVVTYTANFDAEWAQDGQTYEDAGEKDPTNHTEELRYSYGHEFEHFVYYPCCLKYLPEEKHSADENGYCICGAFAVVQDFNGGKVNPECPMEGMTDEEWALHVEQQFGGFDATKWVLFGAPGEGIVPADVTPETFAIMNTMIIKEGYVIVGMAYDAEGTQPYNGEAITKPTTLYLIWESTHVCADNLTHVAAQDATCTDTGIVEHWKCSCGKYYSDDQATTEIDEDDTIVDIDLTNHAGEQCLGTASDPTLDLTHHGVYCDACDEIWDEENPNEPHVAGEDGYCVCGNFELCIDFSGGKITTTPPEGMSQEVWDSLVESMIGSYEATEWCMFSAGFSKMTIEDGMFVKDGYNYVGLAYDKDGTQPYNGEDITKPTTLYLIWESTHVCADNLTHVAAKDATCIATGTVEHWYCEDCDRYYSDDQAITEIDEDDTIAPVNPDNHVGGVSFVYENVTDTTHDKITVCSDCNKRTATATEPHDYTTGTSAHTCACEAVEKFTLSFDLNGGTLADEYGEFEAYIQDGKFILPDIEYGALIQYNRFYQEGWLVKEGYHITGFEDEDGNFHSLESDDIFTMEGDTTLAVVWEVNTYTLTVNVRATGELVDLTVPYGANLLEVLAAAAEDGKIPALGEKIRVNNADQNGENLPYQYSYYVDDDEEPGWIAVDENFTMPAEDFAIDQDHGQNGWVFSDFGDGRVGAEYCVFEDGYLGSGWHYIDENYDDVEGGAWYYFAEGTGAWAGGWFFRVEGLTRVPYPTEPINGWTYEADADALAYDPSFIDKDEAWFLFDEEGKFQYDTNGDIGWYEINDANELRYMNHGMLEWHPGLIKNGDDYYYFIGDVVNGGNIAAEGDTWITRGNDVEGFTEGHIYNFAEGKLSGAHGIVDGKYYENSRLMAGNGLTKIQVEGETKFIYVRSNGYIVVNAEYYVPANDKGVVPGTYAFDENGYLINPELTGKDGIYWENGAWYYYENGKICYNKGLIEVTEIWYDGEGTVETTAVIYVRSNGQLAMGYYYVTNVANYNGSVAIASGTKLLFDNYGAMAAAMNGIVDGKYYQNNQIVYGAGVVEIEEGKYIYVKSDGTVVMNRNYWITNVGDTGVVAKLYTFDENGYFTPEFVSDQKDGIVDGYYYENGAIAYGKGLTEYNGGLIYVRSNGQVATGKYWITTTNGLKESGYYTFGEDGMMIN